MTNNGYDSRVSVVMGAFTSLPPGATWLDAAHAAVAALDEAGPPTIEAKVLAAADAGARAAVEYALRRAAGVGVDG